jgi:hypothetical protein
VPENTYGYEDALEEFECTFDSYFKLVRSQKLESEENEGHFIGYFYAVGEHLYSPNSKPKYSTSEIVSVIFEIRERMHYCGFNKNSPHSISGSINVKPAIAVAGTNDLKIVISRAKIMSFEKIIQLCGFFSTKEI